MKKIIITTAAAILLIAGLSTTITVFALNRDRNLPEPVIETEEDAANYITQMAEIDEEYGVPEITVYPEGHKETVKISDELTVHIYETPAIESFDEGYSTGGKYASIKGENNSYKYMLKINDGTDELVVDLHNTMAMGVYSVVWMDEETIWGTLHVNPSLEELVVYNMETGLNIYYGLFFTRDENGELYYVKPTPHFSSEKVPETIVDSKENVIYKTEAGECIIGDMVIVKDCFVFYTEKDDVRKLVAVSQKDGSVLFEKENVALGKIVPE